MGDGVQVVHKRTGGIYTVISTSSQYKEGNKWVRCVVYKDQNGQIYVRKAQDFTDRFQKFKP